MRCAICGHPKDAHGQGTGKCRHVYQDGGICPCDEFAEALTLPEYVEDLGAAFEDPAPPGWEKLMARQVDDLLDAINAEPHSPALADAAARLGGMVMTLARVVDEHARKLEDIAGPQ